MLCNYCDNICLDIAQHSVSTTSNMTETKCPYLILKYRLWIGTNKSVLLINLFVSLVNLVQVGAIQQSLLVQDTRVSIQTKFLQVSTE